MFTLYAITTNGAAELFSHDMLTVVQDVADSTCGKLMIEGPDGTIFWQSWNYDDKDNA